MIFQQGDIVRSVAGHDKGTLYFVVNRYEDFVSLVNGKQKKLNSPKSKRIKHVVSVGVWTNPVTERLKNGGSVLDSEIRRTLAVFRNRFRETKEV